jgi:UPF0755 protein
MSDRSAEERERARLEREARRAARRGEAPLPPPPEPAREPPQPASEPRPVDEAPAPVPSPARPPEPPPAFEPPRRPAAHPRRSAAERRAAATEFLHGRGGGGRPRGDGASRRPRVAIVAIAGGLAVLVVAWFLLSLFQPLKGDGTGEVSVTIPRGASVGDIADLLEREGVISSAFFFRARATLAGKGGDFKAGEFPLREDMSYGAAMEAISGTPPVPDTVTITIPEGLSRSETKDLIGDSLRGDYMAASLRSPRLDPADYGGKAAENLEGFLFPATYELKPGQPVSALVDRQLDTFERELAKVDLRYAKSKNLTAYDVLTIASMIDREAQLASERRLVASVIYNRLSQGIHLGIDATIRFATGNWSEPLKESELAIDSGYNTRLNPGLPPGPIGNPGLAAIEAAAHPAKTDFIYYVVKPCGNGAHAFSSSDAEFQEDVDRYNAERDRQGGQSPTDC